MSQAASRRYAAKLARKSPTELATLCAVPATSLARSSVFGTYASPHPPAMIVMTYRAPIHHPYFRAVPAFIGKPRDARLYVRLRPPVPTKQKLIIWRFRALSKRLFFVDAQIDGQQQRLIEPRALRAFRRKLYDRQLRFGEEKRAHRRLRFSIRRKPGPQPGFRSL